MIIAFKDLKGFVAAAASPVILHDPSKRLLYVVKGCSILVYKLKNEKELEEAKKEISERRHISIVEASIVDSVDPATATEGAPQVKELDKFLRKAIGRKIVSALAWESGVMIKLDSGETLSLLILGPWGYVIAKE